MSYIPLTEPRLEELLDNVGSKFALTCLAAKRARQINEYYHQLGEGLGRIVPPQVTSVSRKALTIALEEIDQRKIVAIEPKDEDEDTDSDSDDTIEVVKEVIEVTDDGEGA